MFSPLLAGMYLLAIDSTALVLVLVCSFVALIVGGAGTFMVMRLSGLRIVDDSKKEAERIIEQAKKDGQTSVKEMELDASKQLIEKQEAFEKKVSKSREQMKEQEIKLNKRESDHERKSETLSLKEKQLADKDRDLESRSKEVVTEQTRVKQQSENLRQELLRITDLSQEQARELLMNNIEKECEHEVAQLIQQKTEAAKDEAKAKSQDIVINAIQRFAAEHTSTATVTNIQLPSDDLKGRVIGREGRNIRAFEQITGVDVIVDDTPGVVVVSCFDPVRRATAAETMQVLIEDGRIHPTRIEEVFNTTTESINERIVQYGKDACVEANIQGLHPRIVDAMGRLHFRTSYGQNVLRHSIEVAFLSQLIADQLDMDGTIARRAGFLHDVGKALDHDSEGGHPAIGESFARKYGEKREEVLNAIAGHHFDIDVTTPYTPIVAAADAVSGSRPGARRESMERYIKRLEQLEAIAMNMEGVKASYAIQAGREIRVIVDAKQVDDAGSSKLARDIAKQIEEEMTYPGEVQVTVLREVRQVEYAR